MLVAALILGIVAFVALVNYILSAATWSLVVVFVASGLGLALFIADTLRKGKDRGEGEGSDCRSEDLRRGR